MHILLADRRSRTRFALGALLTQWFEYAVISEADNADELLTSTETCCPDLILLDWELQEMNAATLLGMLRTRCADVVVIVLGSRSEWRETALDAGAVAFISKGSPPDQLLAAIENLISRDQFVSGWR